MAGVFSLPFSCACSACILSLFTCILTLCRSFCRRYSSGNGIRHNNSDYYWQRPAGRIVAGCAGAPPTDRLSAWPADALLPTASDDDAYYWRLRDAHHGRPIESFGFGISSQSPDERPVPPPRRRALKNLQYSVEAGQVTPFGLGKLSYQKASIHNYDLTPSNQASARGSFRSDGSGQSQVRRPFSQLSFVGANLRVATDNKFAPQSRFVRSSLQSSMPARTQTLLPFHQRQVTTINQPQEARFQTSSPTGITSHFPQSFGNFAKEFSSIREPKNSLVEQTRPDKFNFELQPHLQELPSLQPIHAFTPNQVDLPLPPLTQPFHRATQEHSVMRATVPIGRSNWQFAGRLLSRPLPLEPVLEFMSDSVEGQARPAIGEFDQT